MRWEIRGADRATGRDSTMILDAPTEAMAVRDAGDAGMLIESCRVLPNALPYARPVATPRARTSALRFFVGAWIISAFVILVIAIIAASHHPAASNSSPPTSPPQVAAARRQLVDRWERMGIISDLRISDVSYVSVGDTFLAGRFSDKEKIASALFGRCVDADPQCIGLVFKDDRTGKEIGEFSKYSGFSMK